MGPTQSMEVNLSSKAERTTQSLKVEMSKSGQENSLKCPPVLPLALLRFRIPVASKEKSEPMIGNDNFSPLLSSLWKVLSSFHKFLLRPSLVIQAHPYQPGNCVLCQKAEQQAT